MLESSIDKAICSKCEVEVRENTLFCYNCGTRIVEHLASEKEKASDAFVRAPFRPEVGLEASFPEPTAHDSKVALDDLAERIKIGGESINGNSIALAAAERKRARSSKKKGREYEWEPIDDPPGRLLFLVGIGITVLSGLAVLSTMIWR